MCHRCCSGSSRCAIDYQLCSCQIIEFEVDQRNVDSVPSSNALPSSRIWASTNHGQYEGRPGGRSLWMLEQTYLPTTFARVCSIILLHWRVRISRWRIHRVPSTSFRRYTPDPGLVWISRTTSSRARETRSQHRPTIATRAVARTAAQRSAVQGNCRGQMRKRVTAARQQ